MLTPAQKPRGVARITFIFMDGPWVLLGEPPEGPQLAKTARARILRRLPATAGQYRLRPARSKQPTFGATDVAHIRPFAGIHFARDRNPDISTLIAPPYDVLDEKGKAALQ